MAIDTKTMGWLQLVVGIVALYGAWKGNLALAVGALGLALLVMGYHHTLAQAHKIF